MRKTFIPLLVLFSALQFGIADEPPVPTHRILPEDVVQGSVHQWRMGTNKYAVSWSYTEAGAMKSLAFREANEGRKTCTAVGRFQTPPCEIRFQPMPPMFTNYAQWKEGWLKHRTDKFFGVTEEDANRIVAGLKGQ